MNLEQVKNDISKEWESVQAMLKESLKSDCLYLDSINEYLLTLRGKQIRPLLSILAAKAYGEVDERAVVCAVVSEMFHTATLLHDDVADDASKRRGKDTVQKIFSPAASVLTGDFWLAKSLSLLNRVGDYQVLSFFTKAVEELSEGELFQMQKAQEMDTNEDDYYNIISRKTSSLFVAAVSSAVYCAGAPKDVVEGMSRFAYHLGISFQIRDDIFDYMPALNTGKKSGEDMKERKLTLPLIAAIRNSPKEESSSILDMIKRGISEEDEVLFVTDFVNKYNGLEYSHLSLENHCKLAVKSLDCVRDSLYKRHLVSLAEYAGKREV